MTALYIMCLTSAKPTAKFKLSFVQTQRESDSQQLQADARTAREANGNEDSELYL